MDLVGRLAQFVPRGARTWPDLSARSCSPPSRSSECPARDSPRLAVKCYTRKPLRRRSPSPVATSTRARPLRKSAKARSRRACDMSECSATACAPSNSVWLRRGTENEKNTPKSKSSRDLASIPATCDATTRNPQQSDKRK